MHITKRDAVLMHMARLIAAREKEILQANAQDVAQFAGDDLALYDRLKLDQAKILGMVQSLESLARQSDPLGVERYRFTHANGMEITNRTAAFGTVLIIYESRPDVTIEATGIAFKSGNHILLKGGKEARRSNLLLTNLWQESLRSQNIAEDWVRYLDFSREETRDFLLRPSEKVDLIVPRGGEKLIDFVRKHARCPLIISGRGNNFLFVARDADPDMARQLIINAKTSKISACNALDKVLIDSGLPEKEGFLRELTQQLGEYKVRILTDARLASYGYGQELGEEAVWYQEFLDYKIVLGEVKDLGAAIEMINTYSGGHSATIVSRNPESAARFMDEVDAAAVYHNASTRFTDGGQFGLGGELAISTDKLHQRGPMGLQHLTTNKWYVSGDGQVRKEA